MSRLRFQFQRKARSDIKWNRFRFLTRLCATCISCVQLHYEHIWTHMNTWTLRGRESLRMDWMRCRLGHVVMALEPMEPGAVLYWRVRLGVPRFRRPKLKTSRRRLRHGKWMKMADSCNIWSEYEWWVKMTYNWTCSSVVESTSWEVNQIHHNGFPAPPTFCKHVLLSIRA